METAFFILIFASRNFSVGNGLFLRLGVFHGVAELFDAAGIFAVLQIASHFLKLADIRFCHMNHLAANVTNFLDSVNQIE